MWKKNEEEARKEKEETIWRVKDFLNEEENCRYVRA